MLLLGTMETELAPLASANAAAAAAPAQDDNDDGAAARASEGGEAAGGPGGSEASNEPREPSVRQRRGAGGRRRFVPWVRSLFRAPEGADLSSGRVTAYGVGAISFSILADMPGFYLQAFLLQVAGVNPTASGTLLLVSKVRALEPLERKGGRGLGNAQRGSRVCTPRTPSIGSPRLHGLTLPRRAILSLLSLPAALRPCGPAPHLPSAP